MNKNYKENAEIVLDKVEDLIITNIDTLEAFEEADLLAKHSGKRYNTLDELWEDCNVYRR